HLGDARAEDLQLDGGGWCRERDHQCHSGDHATEPFHRFPRYFGGVGACAAGRISPDPTRASGSLPWIACSNARGTSSTTRWGKRDVMSGGGAPRVSRAGQTTITPFFLMSSAVTQGVRAGSTKS